MRARLSLSMLMLSLTAPLAFADGGGRPATPPPTSTGSAPGSGSQSGTEKSPRQLAEAWYGDAYDDVARAKDALGAETPDPKRAQKMFKRAIDRATRALDYDKNYFEALNLQGFSWRKLGNYEKSLEAYAACLRIEPNYAPAREYYGEALLESGDRAGAELQLALLKKLSAEELVKQLEAALAAVPVTAAKLAK